MTEILITINMITDRIERNRFRVTKLEYTDDDMILYIEAKSIDDSNKTMVYRSTLKDFL